MDIKEIIVRLNALTADAQSKRNTLKDLHVQAEQMKEKVEETISKSASTIKAFDEAVESYKKCSIEWWRKFYASHTSAQVQDEISRLNNSIKAANRELKEYELICGKSYSDDIKTLSSEISKKSQIDGIFKQKIVKAAQKAMCYEVCIYLGRDGWKLKAFDDKCTSGCFHLLE